jgi:diguanylate cyclase
VTDDGNIQSGSLLSADVEYAVQVLDKAVSMHTQWLQSLHEAIICRSPIPDNILLPNAHQLCALGCWYYHEASEVLARYPEFHAIEGTHRVMHDQARELATRYQDEQPIDSRLYREFIQNQQNLVQLLHKLKEKLLISLHSFDDLTGVIRREAFSVLASSVHAKAKRSGEVYTVAMCDVDRFKSINDAYGHLAGDKALQIIAQMMIHNVREADTICRYGGEEFLILLPQTEIDGALVVMEKIRALLEQTSIEIDPGRDIAVTASFGVAQWLPDLNFEQVVRQADVALYNAKVQGRNQVVQWGV